MFSMESLVVEKEDLESKGMEFAETIAANDMMSVAITKKAINKTLEISGMRINKGLNLLS